MVGFGLGNRFGRGGALGGVNAPTLPAPTLTWNSLSSDTTPDFLVDLPSFYGVGDARNAAAGDHLILEYQPQAGGSWTQYLDRTLSIGDITDDTIAETSVGAVASGNYYFRGRLERGALIGANSANEEVTIAATIFSLTYTDSKTNTVGGTSITYNSGGNPSIGAADANRVVAVAIMARIGAPSSVVSVTIGGISATQVPGAAANPSQLVTDIWYASVPTGITAAVVVNYGSATVVSGVALYRIITATPTPHDGQHNSGTISNGSPITKSVTIPSGGGMVGSYGFIPASDGVTNTWSGGTITKDVDVSVGATGRYFSAAHDTTDSGLVSVTVTPSAQTNTGTISLASWD